jgi:murein DD-endopeptidase MepM/ murein hydrolase activator NlpD
VVPIASTINAGTAGIQQFFSTLYNREGWERAVSADGLFAVYNSLFGYPFDYAIEPILPSGLRQPALLLPFEAGKAWAFTGGPHGGWDSGSAWAALDFAPPTNALGCIPSNEWVTASADGQILRADHGAVIQELDNDGLEQTGWALLYMHIETRDRIQPGAYLRAGDRIGHPSCEGGLASGTHVHLARKYNGEWIPADQQLPFVLDGWVSRGTGSLYDGYLERDGKIVEAYEGRSSDNIILR